MKITIFSLCAVWIATFLAAQATPWAERHTPPLFYLLAVGGAVWAGFLFLARRISASRGGAEAAQGYSEPVPAEAWAPKNLGLLALSFIATWLWLRLASGSGSFILVEAGYYGLLFLGGYLLRRFGNSGQYVPLLYALLLILAATAEKTIFFLGDPAARFQFGPEITLFAMSRAVSTMTMLPLDAAVLWGGWAVSRALAAKHSAAPAQTDVSPA